MAHCWASVLLSKAYHPQTQGLTEPTNRTTFHSLKHYLNTLYETWDEHLVAVELAYNTSLHAALGCTPFEVAYGFNPRPSDPQA